MERKIGTETQLADPPSWAGDPFFLSITSGKGGVGKTCLAANLALALQSLSLDVLLVDFDLGLANVDVLFGLDPRRCVKDFLDGGCELRDCLVSGPRGLKILPAASGFPEVTGIPDEAMNRIFNAIREFEVPPETVVLDTAAGISPQVLHCVRSADETVLITTPEPTALTDAYAVLKALIARGPLPPIHLLVNQTESMEEAYRTGNKLVSVAKRFLSAEVHPLGFVPRDPSVHEASVRQTSFLLDAAGCAAARSTRFVASKLASRIRATRRNHGTVRS